MDSLLRELYLEQLEKEIKSFDNGWGHDEYLKSLIELKSSFLEYFGDEK